MTPINWVLTQINATQLTYHYICHSSFAELSRFHRIGNTVNRTCNTDRYILNCLLIMAVVFTPLQGALSGLGNACPADHHTMATGERACDNHSANTATTSEKDRCSRDCNDGGCGCVCGLAHGTVFLPTVTQIPLIDRHPVFQVDPLNRKIGHITSPPLHPPQMQL